MKRLFSPWRSKYIESFSEKASDKDECIFCTALKSEDEESRLLLFRGKSSFALMNLYPYNSGHLMIVPNRHISNLLHLTEDETLEIMSITKKMIVAISGIMKPDGFNYGLNAGRASGAGIDQHIHFHLVPRWQGDTNFMPILSDTKVVSEEMKETWRKLRSFISSS